MKKLIIVCTSIVVLCSSAFVGGKVLFEDHFNENENGWELGSKESADLEIKNGKLFMECKKFPAGGGYWFKVPDLKLPLSGFKMKCTTKWLRNKLQNDTYSPYGFIIDNYYFLVYADGERRLLFYNKDTKAYETIVDWGEASAIKTTTTGENTFEIVYADGKAAFYCNGEMLYKKPVTFVEGESLKLYIEKSEVVEFDDLIVTD